MIYCVEPVVCDYGVFERTYDEEGNAKDNLIVICNESDNAQLIAKILNKDTSHKIWEHRQKGEWIKHTSEEMTKMGFVKCSKCKAGFRRYERGIRKSDVPYIDGQPYELHLIDNFCPNCGADMRKGGAE